MHQESLRISPKRERQAIIAILIFALLHGALYVFIVPPWQHYDEPNHFEYVWLVAFRPGIPQKGDYDLSMRLEVALSMVDHGFFENLDYGLNLDVPIEEPVWIGPYQQLGEPPLYYFVASIPVRLFKFADVNTQLYVARFVSLFFLLTTVWFAYGVTVEITPNGHLLRILMPLSLAMLPGFVDVMTAVNSDSAAIAVFSFFLWGSVRLIQRGFSILNFVLVILAVVLSYFTKNTAYISIILLPGVLILSLLHGTKWLKISWLVLGVCTILGFILIFGGGDVRFWYRQTNQNVPTKVETQLAPVGENALCIDMQSDENQSSTQTRQLLPGEAVDSIRGEPFTLGVWMWASEPTIVRLPILRSVEGPQSTSNQVELGTEKKI